MRLLALLLALGLPAFAAEKPNVIFILADDLGYGDLGCYGQKLIQTPHLDRMAAEGMRFTQFYAGSTVCAPSRAVLMTGRHTGHVSVRGNAGGKKLEDVAAFRPQTLRDEEQTVAQLLKGAGYATALIGKWGLGELGSGAEPTRKGFDHFFGFLNQGHAHNYYPAWLIRGTERFALRNDVPGDGPFGSGVAAKKVDYAHDLFAADALAWIEQQKDAPFFLYLALTTPHANNEAARKLGNGQEVPHFGPYADRDWTEPNKGQAAMISRMDTDIGRLFALLKRLGLDEKTLVFFSSDNGPHKEGGNDPNLFNASGGLRGLKRALTDGGIRVPFLARWPGKIAPGVTSTHVGYFGDLMATLAELSGAAPPAEAAEGNRGRRAGEPNLDSISFLPTLLGQPADRQAKHEFLYWEFHEGGTKQAVLYDGRWKGIRQRPAAPLVLYDLQSDPGEVTNVAADHPDIVSKLDAYLAHARTDSPDWPIREPNPAKRPASPEIEPAAAK